MHDSPLTASNYQRVFLGKHHHSRLYSVNTFQRWPNEAFRFHSQLYRGKRDEPSPRGRRQWLQLVRDEGTWAMLRVERRWKGFPSGKHKKGKTHERYGEDNFVVLHIGWWWSPVKCLWNICCYATLLPGLWQFQCRGKTRSPGYWKREH